MQHELLVDERKSCSGIEKNNGGMGFMRSVPMSTSASSEISSAVV
jgi:hypothetical protein